MIFKHGPQPFYCQKCDMDCSKDKKAVRLEGIFHQGGNEPHWAVLVLCGECKKLVSEEEKE